MHCRSLKEKEERKGQKSYLNIMAENFPNLGRDMDIWTHEAQKSYPKQDQPKEN